MQENTRLQEVKIFYMEEFSRIEKVRGLEKVRENNVDIQFINNS